MNKTKKILIIFSIIFNFASIGWQIYDIVMWFMNPKARTPVFYLVFDFITIFALIAVAVLLIMAIWNNGKLFRARYGYYMTALVISVIMNLFSIATLFLIITMFISDWEWITPEKEKTINVGDNVDVVVKTKEQKIKELREKREKGEITETEFQEELMKLL